MKRRPRIYQMLHFPLQGAGTGIYADSLCRSLMERGYQVKALCAGHFPEKRDYPVRTILFNDGRNGKFDLDFDIPVFASHPLSRGPTFGELAPAQERAYLRAFRTAVKEELADFRPDLVHVHHGWIIGAIMSGAGIPYVVSLHGTEYYAFKKYGSYQGPVLEGLRGSAKILALTEEQEDQASSAYGLDKNRIMVAGSGVDTGEFRPKPVDAKELLEKFGVDPGGRPIVLYAGRLSPEKGADTLIRAADIYAREGRRPLTLVAGGGRLEKRLQKMAERKKIPDVHFLGNQPHRDMEKFMNIADVLAVTSEYESFGKVAVEALACGTPVIASDIGGLRHIVREPFGSLFKIGDHRALARAVGRMLAEHRKAGISGRAARYARDNFSWDRTVDRVESIYGGIFRND